MNCGNSADVSAGRIECRRIRDSVDGSDEEQQAYQPDGILELQGNLEQEETIPNSELLISRKQYITLRIGFLRILS
jgi:hypothetical protein